MSDIECHGHLGLRIIGRTKKTEKYEVYSLYDDSVLGKIYWHGYWRQYVFEPNTNCIWSSDCLYELSLNLKMLMETRKKKNKDVDTERILKRIKEKHPMLLPLTDARNFIKEIEVVP